MTPPVTTTMPQATEEALLMMDEVSTEHMAWLKRVHCTLLFHDDGHGDPHCRAIEDGLAKKVAENFGEGRAAFARLKQAREQMERMAGQLTAAATRGHRLDPQTYMAFMETVGNYHAEGRQVELLLHQALAETDPLTGLHNRWGMMRDLRREWVRATRTNTPCCLAIVDLDHFKAVNDVHGHLTGDQVLCAAARFFLRRLRPYDMVYRFGGEEFLFCLPNTAPKQARRVLDRLRLLMARLPLRSLDGKRMSVTVSIGVAEMTPDTPPDAAIALADQALYGAKEAGRNRVHVADEDDMG
ncbi:MAG TPA: diguanylate cyclase [Patescibacteria group bacterium]|nr:diguanylate cyclase [Patescibacteria group bacterium]